MWSAAWVRPLAILLSIGLHGGAVLAVVNGPAQTQEDAPSDSLELSMAPPEGETLVEEEKSVDSVAQEETVASIKTPEPPPPPEPEAIEPVKIVAPDAETIEAAIKPPEELPPEEPKPEPPVEQIVTLPLKQETEAQAQTVNAAEESFASREVGVENGIKRGGGMTRAAYAAAVKKQIAKNRKRPTGQGHGVVSIAFTIGPQGHVDRLDVVKSVNSAIDQTARQIVASIKLPPPPDGSFQATIKINFE